MSETWYTVDATGHVPGIAAELPPGRVLLDDNTMQMIDHEWAEEETTQPLTQEAPPVEAHVEEEAPAASGG